MQAWYVFTYVFVTLIADKLKNIYFLLGKRKTRCFKCSGCLAEDCGICKYCVDKPKYGGKGVLKQSCLKRKCSEIQHQVNDGMNHYLLKKWCIDIKNLNIHVAGSITCTPKETSSTSESLH